MDTEARISTLENGLHLFFETLESIEREIEAFRALAASDGLPQPDPDYLLSSLLTIIKATTASRFRV